MAAATSSYFQVAPGHQPLLRMAGVDADAVFDHPEIRVWRSLPERENCTLDVAVPEGSPVRLHIKRFREARDAEREASGIRLLEDAGIGTVPLVGWGRGGSSRGFVITQDLAGYAPADVLLREGVEFGRLCGPLADIAGSLHDAGLHHRDLYLCHFFVRVEPAVEVRLIDAARVRRLPRWPLRQRWIVKDLAQLWYSMAGIAQMTASQRLELLQRYAQKRNIGGIDRLRRQIERKARTIARHDAKLNERQPNRNISIPKTAKERRR